MYLGRITLLQMCCHVMGNMWREQMGWHRGSLALLTRLLHVVYVSGLQWLQSTWALMSV